MPPFCRYYIINEQLFQVTYPTDQHKCEFRYKKHTFDTVDKCVLSFFSIVIFL